MLIRINDQPIALGQPLTAADLEGAALSRPGFWQRLLNRTNDGLTRYEVSNCKATCFDDAFDLYPCTHGYLTPDRQWRTDCHVLLTGGKVASAVLRIIEGRYAAMEFVERFRESGTAVLGAPLAVDRWTTRWTNGSAVVTSVLRPDAKNACFLFEHTAE